MYKVLVGSGLFILAVAACTTTVNGAPSSGSSGSGNGSSGSSGSAGACVANNTDGSSSCEGNQEPCAGGQYCSVNICTSGCLTTANCPNGQFCDMSASSTDHILDKPIGICRACPTTTTNTSSSSSSSTSGATTNGTCDDVHGAYTMTADPGSSQGCGTVSGECTVVQSGCVLTVSCPQAFATSSQQVTINAQDTGTYTGSTTFDGTTINENCTLTFSTASSSMLIDCQITANGGAADCKADGAKK